MQRQAYALSRVPCVSWGFDHGARPPLVFLDDANAPHCQKNNGFSDLGNYAAWPKVAGAVIQALLKPQNFANTIGKPVWAVADRLCREKDT